MSNDFLIKDARELVALAENSDPVKEYYRTLPLGQIWASGTRSGRHQILHQEQSSHDAITRLQEILFVHSPSPREAELAVRWYLNDTHVKIPEASSVIPENSTVRIDGKRYWHDDFRHTGTLSYLNNYAPPETIVELGAGCGGLARLAKIKWPGIRYIIIDLPDTLAYSMMFLRSNFPELKWHWVSEASSPIPEEAEFVFIPVGLESAIYGERFSLFINTASLGEMRHETVRHWFKFIEKKCRFDFVCSVNRFLNSVGPEEAEYRKLENGHAFCFDNRWIIIDWELMPRFLRCPWMNRHARQLLVIGERIENPIQYDYHDLLDPLNASWNHDKNHMTSFSPPINEDFTQNGILYRLWNAYRLNPRDDTRDGLKRYIRYLGNGMTIEDEFHL